MGAWGYYNFDNDDAADFAGEFRDNHTEAMLYEALATAAEEEDYLEVDAAGQALAAAEIVAAILGKPSKDFPADLIPVIVKLDASESEDLRDLATEAVEAVLKKSEMQEQWAESEDYANWQKLQQELLERLK